MEKWKEELDVLKKLISRIENVILNVEKNYFTSDTGISILSTKSKVHEEDENKPKKFIVNSSKREERAVKLLRVSYLIKTDL